MAINIENIITAEDLGEPYTGLVYKIGIENTIKFAAKFRGRQINFKKWHVRDSRCYEEISELFGSEAATKVAKLYSGLTIYFPEIKTACKEKIKSLIADNFNGYNYAELAKQFGYSERHIYRITKEKECRHKITDEAQLNFFDLL